MQLGGQLEDPRLAAELLWPSAAEEDPGKLNLTRLQSSVAPSFKVGRFHCSWGFLVAVVRPAGLLETCCLLVYLSSRIEFVGGHVAEVWLPSWAPTGLHRATIPWRMLRCVW